MSAYHQHFGERHGEESRPTHYHQWKQDRPFHLDYVFVPTAWVERGLAVQVGAYAGWEDLSDHRPVCVDVVP